MKWFTVSFTFLLCLSASHLVLLPSATANSGIVKQTNNLPPQQGQRRVAMTLQRTVCFGFCPIYKLSIYGDGTVVYEGERYVKVKGRQTTTISKAAVKQLMREFERIEYFALSDQYTGGPTDMPSAITSLTVGKRSKTIHHYLGAPNAPQALTKLENKIDEVVNSKQWIGTDEERRSLSGQR